MILPINTVLLIKVKDVVYTQISGERCFRNGSHTKALISSAMVSFTIQE